MINLGGHEVITINELVRLVEELTGKTATVLHGPSNPAEMRTNQADVSKARALLGWQPEVNLVEGVKRLVDWYLAEREWAREVDTS